MCARLSVAASVVVMVVLCNSAHADVLVRIDKSAQRMIVTVDGEQRHVWPVSTGRAGYGQRPAMEAPTAAAKEEPK